MEHVFKCIIGPNNYEAWLEEMGEAFDLSHAIAFGEAVGSKAEHKRASEKLSDVLHAIHWRAEQSSDVCEEEVRRHGFCRHCEAK